MWLVENKPVMLKKKTLSLASALSIVQLRATVQRDSLPGSMVVGPYWATFMF